MFFPSAQNLKESTDKAVSYLEGRLHSLTNSYAAAMTSYALANENKLNKQILFKFRPTGFATRQYCLTYWETIKSRFYKDMNFFHRCSLMLTIPTPTD